MLPEVHKSHRFSCVSRWTGRGGKKPPGDAQGSCCRGFGGKSSQRQGEERWEGNTLVFLGILGVSVLNVALWLNAHFEGTQLVQGHVLTVI